MRALRILSLLAVLIIFITEIAIADMPDLKLPFSGGVTWMLTRGYDDEDGTHVDYGKWADDKYALDFSASSCSESWNKPILSVSGGRIIVADIFDDSGYGKNIVIDHGYGYRSRYAHLNSILVNVGDIVSQGQEIGRSGNTGNVIGGDCKYPGTHLHFALYYNGKACLPEPMSGYVNFTEFKSYKSDNYFNKHSFSFQNHSSEAWTTGYDTEEFQGNDINTWGVHIIGNNPGIVSPSFSPGILASKKRIKFSARVLGNKGNPVNAYMYIKDETGSWNNPILIGATATNQDYKEYIIDLSKMSLRKDLEIRQFSLELTNGGNGGNEYWAIDWLKIDDIDVVDSKNNKKQDSLINSEEIKRTLVLKTTPASYSEIKVSWNDILGVNQYDVCIDGYKDGKEIDYCTTVSGTSTTFNGLNNNTQYNFSMKAHINGELIESKYKESQKTLKFNTRNVSIDEITTCKKVSGEYNPITPLEEFNIDDDVFMFLRLRDNYPKRSMYLKFDLRDSKNRLVGSFDRLGNYTNRSDKFTTYCKLKWNKAPKKRGIYKVNISYGPDIYSSNNYLVSYTFALGTKKSRRPSIVKGFRITSPGAVSIN